MVGTEMYVKIQELKRKGYKKQRAARELAIDTKTVRKYWDMSEAAYSEYLLETKERAKIMDPYRGFVLEQVEQHPEITSAIIYDHLLEEFLDFAPSYRSVRLYVCNLRNAEGIPAPQKIRQYCEVAETPLGHQGQVDMGQKVMRDSYGKNVRVYIFAMVLSASRYKYAQFQLEPFTAQSFVEAHDAAFRYFGGRPKEIVYDQDRVMVVSENAGDIILTEAFEQYQSYAGFGVHLCRGYDPESKGKVEAVVKYVKNNFLTCRVFHGISRLNSEGLAWLDRTGNGQMHETTKMVPKVVFQEERKYLERVPELSGRTLLPKLAAVRKTNVVWYLQNRYQLPLGTYQPGRRVRIEAQEEAGTVRFFDHGSGELLQTHALAPGAGKLVRLTHPDRPRNQKLTELRMQVLQGFGTTELSERFVSGILLHKPRYAKDQMGWLLKLQRQFNGAELDQAMAYCLERSLFGASDLQDTLEYFKALGTEPEQLAPVVLPLKYRLVTAQQRPLQAYESLWKGGDSR